MFVKLLPILAVWGVFLGSALLEVGGDALMRQGLKGGGWRYLLLGAASLAAYGILVNSLNWDFSRLLGVYVAAFALLSLLAGRFYFGEVQPLSTWLGLGLIVLGGLVIQFGGES